MFDRWDTSDVVMFSIGANINQLSEFIDVFGWRSVGLVDNAGVYDSWRVPSPEAPYPQDYIIDQQGIVRYWSDEYEAQEVIATIERLLAAGVKETPVQRRPRLELALVPCPSRGRVRLAVTGFRPDARVEVLDAVGRVVGRVGVPSGGQWDCGLPAGAYIVRLVSGTEIVCRPLAIAR